MEANSHNKKSHLRIKQKQFRLYTMNTSILHITNGDCTTNYLKHMHIRGDFITWREMLCEGKSEVQVGTEMFWRSRFNFLKKSFNFSKRHFINFTLKEYRKLCQEKAQEEIVLWFENDLSSQINMLAVLSWLKRHRNSHTIYLVTNKASQMIGKHVPFSQLSEIQLKQNYTYKMSLSEDDMDYADYVWQLYCSQDPLQLQHVHQYKPNNKFTNLTTALSSHLQRFPSLENGLNSVENQLVTLASEQIYTSKNAFVKALIKKKNMYGFGDVQYTKKIDDLHAFFHSLSPVKLNDTGKNVQRKIAHAYAKLRNDDAFLGGAKKYNYIYDNSIEKLLQITSL